MTPCSFRGPRPKRKRFFGAGPNSLDGQNALSFCDSSSGALIGDDDTGWVPATPDIFKCEVSVAKIAAKLNALVRKCHNAMDKAFFKGADFDEEACEQTALAKFNKVRDKLIAAGVCSGCLDGAHIDAIGAGAISQVDGANDRTFPCNLGP